MKLEKYEDKSKKKRKTILISLGIIVLISVSFLLYKTFASFSESAEFPVMKGQVDYFGNSDVYFVFYNGDKLLDSMPQKDNKENLVFNYGDCDNGASIEWDSEEWAPLVKNLSKSKTRCSLYFNKATNAVEYITELAKIDTTNLKVDDTNEANIRYVGANPNNYIDIGDRDGNGKPILWRVIGVMNNITNFDNGEKVERLVKIRRAESIGEYSWNSSDASQNDGWGINEWSEADLMKLLNPGYEENQDMDPEKNTITVNNSLYWTKGSGNCYNAGRYGYTSCDFTSSGLSEEARRKIAKVRWNTGTAGEEYDENKITAKYMYEGERSTHNGKEICESNGGGSWCNDTVPRTTTWDGYVGLIYPSDYGYAVGGELRETCLGKSMKSYNTEECRTNDWLKPSWLHSWTMTPAPISNKSNHTFFIYYGGDVSVYNTCDPFYIFPTAYLKSSFKILENLHPELEYGTIDNPFIVR